MGVFLKMIISDLFLVLKLLRLERKKILIMCIICLRFLFVFIVKSWGFDWKIFLIYNEICI